MDDCTRALGHGRVWFTAAVVTGVDDHSMGTRGFVKDVLLVEDSESRNEEFAVELHKLKQFQIDIFVDDCHTNRTHALVPYIAQPTH